MSEGIVQAATKGLVVKDGKFLMLQQKTSSGKVWWDLPGGRIKYGEDPVESLKREVFEETKLEVEVGKPIGMWHFFWDEDKIQVVCTAFLCRLKGGEVDIRRNPDESEEFVKYEWLTMEQLFKSSDARLDPKLKKIILDYFMK